MKYNQRQGKRWEKSQSLLKDSALLTFWHPFGYKVDRHSPHPKVLEADKEETGCVRVLFVYMQECVCVCLNSWPETLLYVLNGWKIRRCLIKGPYSTLTQSCCLCAGLQADIKPMWPEMPWEVEWAQKAEPLGCYRICIETEEHDAQLWSGETIPRNMASSETWKYTQGVTLGSLTEVNSL